MTDKQIIIDGAINIEKYYEAFPDGVGYIFNQHLHNDLLGECIIANHTLSEQQEQLKRKEQECEELKKALSKIAKGNISPCCCAEEYAQRALKEV